jgi:hypothetical protein
VRVSGVLPGHFGFGTYVETLPNAGFQSISIEPTRVYNVDAARELPSGKGGDVDALAPQVAGTFMRAYIRAVKPVGAADVRRAPKLLWLPGGAARVQRSEGIGTVSAPRKRCRRSGFAGCGSPRP